MISDYTRKKMSDAKKGKMPKNIGTSFGVRGKSLSEETKGKISNSTKGDKHHMFGKHLSEEHKLKLSIAGKGRIISKETIKKIKKATTGLRGYWKGKKRSPETRLKMKEAQLGEKGNNWRGGIYPENKRIRGSSDYKIWRDKVFERDNFTCQICTKRGGTLNADHIKPFSQFPELILEINNGRTLCVPCHKKTETYGWKIYNKLSPVIPTIPL